jgi:hypothetical protein
MPRTSKQGEALTDEEMAGLRGKKLTEAQCPDCKSLGFLAGPCGGGSQNFKCASASCGSRFNDMGPFGIERISDAKPDAPPDTGNLTPYRGNTRFDREDPL